MAIGLYRRIALRVFGPQAERAVRRNERIGFALQRAQIRLRPEVYIASAFLTAMLAGLAGMVIVTMFAVYALASGDAANVRAIAIFIPLPFLAAAGVYMISVMLPDMRGRNRARDIDAKLPYALNYIATMASAGATPERIFTSLSKQDVYGEVANEAAVISRDLNILGIDLLNALNNGIDRSPSQYWEDVLQGAITVLTSGGELRDYFNSKSEQYLAANRQDQKQFLESLGVLAESFVVVVVAAPLFLIVILSVMTMFGSSATQMLTLGYLMVLVLLPLAQAGFGVTIKTMTPEA